MINKQMYNANEGGQAFAQWVAEHAATLPIKLNFKSTRFVPGGLQKQVTGLPEALANYVWMSEGTTHGNWSETAALLARFRNELSAAISANDDAAACMVCKEIIRWGGDRNPLVGVMPFLLELANQKELVAYLTCTRQDFALDTAALSGALQVCMMNSMLTKIHALASDDGLPIYDSRVAAATGALVELWRRSTGRSAEALPELLSFPATQPTRTVRHLDDTAQAPGLLLCGKAHKARTTRRWAEAKIRLGWLMQRILALQPGMFSGAATTHIERMHALEASLFMVGYDVACLKQ